LEKIFTHFSITILQINPHGQEGSEDVTSFPDLLDSDLLADVINEAGLIDILGSNLDSVDIPTSPIPTPIQPELEMVCQIQPSPPGTIAPPSSPVPEGKNIHLHKESV
jgi:hypothetical protein